LHVKYLSISHKIDLKITQYIYYNIRTIIMSSSNKPVVLTVNEWEPSQIKYMAPKTNDKGGKSINLISKQTNRNLHFSTPLMMTWGISDFVDDKGESDGKYSISLNFPNEEYKTAPTDAFLKKLKEFENQILDDAVKNSELWWGEEMSRELCKHTFFPFIKYTKTKDTKKIDLSKPPSIRAKVPFYNGRWGVEIYDTKQTQLFPCENENLTPMDFVPKLSNVACVLQCGGIWIGGKGWGLTWKMIQCIVKPREVVSVYGKCRIQLSDEDLDTMEKQEVDDPPADEDEQVAPSKPMPLMRQASISAVPVPAKPVAKPVVVAPVVQQLDTHADDSDDEQVEAAVAVAAVDDVVLEEVVEAVVEEVVVAAPVKKVIKKAPVVVAEEPVPVVASLEPEVAKKKIVKKKV